MNIIITGHKGLIGSFLKKRLENDGHKIILGIDKKEGKDIGFLDDLFVEPKFRGQKIGEKILKELNTVSKSKGWNLIRWITHDDNLRAKALYDRVAVKTKWDLYELK